MSKLDLSRLTEAEQVELLNLLEIEVKTSRYCPHEPSDRQKLFLDLSYTEAFYGGAAGGGKSDALLMAALQYADVPGYSALILRRTFADLSKPGALMDRAHEWLRGSGARWNEQKKQWRFPSGSVLAFGYLDNETDVYQFQSAEYQFCAFDELTQFTDRQYTYLFSRLRRLSGSDVPIRMRSASNPGGIGAAWVQERFIPDDWTPEQGTKVQVIDKNGRAFVPARLVDNPAIDQQSYEKSLENLDEVTRAQLLEGDWQIRPRGNVYKAWSDGVNGHHVITWSQFANVFGQSSIPSHWFGACGQDWGFDPDPCATVWNFVASANSPLPGAIFTPRILTCRSEIPDEVADKINAIEAEEGWGSRIQYRVMSHEASSQCETYRRKCGLSFQKWKPDQIGGIAQMTHVLRLTELDKPHPFKPHLNGRPGYYVVVPDDQLINPKGDEGLALLREEFAAYKYVEQRVTEMKGANRIVPFDFFNHFMDAQRGVAARWFADVKALSADEVFEESLPLGVRRETVTKLEGDQRDLAELARQREVDKRKKEDRENTWSNVIVEANDNPWSLIE
ncbi:MAG: terminase family protein [Acidobacteria bacterium]|nr:terminase family protein [Acidobacteriota bacterium]